MGAGAPGPDPRCLDELARLVQRRREAAGLPRRGRVCLTPFFNAAQARQAAHAARERARNPSPSQARQTFGELCRQWFRNTFRKPPPLPPYACFDLPGADARTCALCEGRDQRQLDVAAAGSVRIGRGAHQQIRQARPRAQPCRVRSGARRAAGDTGPRDRQEVGASKTRGRNSGGFTMLALLPVARITNRPFRAA